MNPEKKRLEAQRQGKENWRLWGPYLAERAWGTVREDYSANGDAWNFFPHEHARSRAYRWGEDGMGGLCDKKQRLCLALAVVITIISSLPLDVAAGAFFGPLAGTLYSVLGATGGAVASFFIARFLGREFMARILTGHINFCTRCSDRLLTKVIFLSRLLPFVSFDIVSYGAGLTMMSMRAFALATFFGALPLTFIYNYFGAALVMSRSLALGFGLLVVAAVFVLPRLIERCDLFSLRRFFRHEEAGGQEEQGKESSRA